MLEDTCFWSLFPFPESSEAELSVSSEALGALGDREGSLFLPDLHSAVPDCSAPFSLAVFALAVNVDE